MEPAGHRERCPDIADVPREEGAHGTGKSDGTAEGNEVETTSGSEDSGLDDAGRNSPTTLGVDDPSERGEETRGRLGAGAPRGEEEEECGAVQSRAMWP